MEIQVQGAGPLYKQDIYKPTFQIFKNIYTFNNKKSVCIKIKKNESRAKIFITIQYKPRTLRTTWNKDGFPIQ